LEGCGSDTLSGGTGVDQITISGAGATKVYGGDGNDTITTTGFLSGNDVIVGGDGVDTLIIGGTVGAGSLTGVTNVEVIKFAAAGDALTLNQGDVAAFTSNSFTVDMSVTGNQSINFGSGSRAFSGTVYVDMTNSGSGNESVIANSSTGSINVVGNMADLNTSDTLTAGGHSTDVITLRADDNSDGAVLTNIAGFTSLTITGVGACDAKLTLGADTEALSITATSMTNEAANLNLLGNVYNGKLTISSGAGADSITGGNGADLIVTGAGADQITIGCGADTVSSGTGADTITLTGTGTAEIVAGDDNDTVAAAGYLSSDDVINTGAGFDTIAISSNTTGSGFYQTTGFERVALSGANTTLTLASNDSAAFVLSTGSVTIDMDAASNQSLVLGNGTLGFTGHVIVEIGSPGASLNDSVLAGGSLATFTVNGSVADIGSGVTITGGNGTDTLTLLADAGAATLTNVTKVDRITLTGVGACDATLTLGTDSTAMTITATSMTNTSADLWVKGATYTGALTISAGAGVDSITGGTGADNINGGAGHDLIVGGAGADTIFGGAGNDTITGGAGGDMIYGGAGCDTFYFSGNGVVSLDTIEDFVSGTGNDQIQIGNAAGFAWGNEAAGFHYSSDGLSNNYALIVLNESSSFDSAASASALADQLFVNNGVDDANGGAYVFIWQDSSSVVHISYGESVTGADTYKDVVKLVGVSLSTLLTNLGTGNIDLTS
jgi:Ca2+-binding RTX toxin-like protein